VSESGAVTSPSAVRAAPRSNPLRLLDLFCGAGGAAMGYHRAGFEVVGVDIKPQPHYPFQFVQGDALKPWEAGIYPPAFDAIHASPPCQDHSQLHKNYGAPAHDTAGLLATTLEWFRLLGLPWVVENVVGAPLPSAVELCGASFGLGASGMDLNRHRRFMSNVAMLTPPCQHRRGLTIGVYGNGTNRWHRRKLGRNLRRAEMREAMGIDWMTHAELGQAVPPAYTEWIGQQLVAYLAGRPLVAAMG
jgi:DNA (cytosine-5)-methyltransferase 1